MVINISMRKANIYLRREQFREQGISPMEEAHRITKIVDPDFEETIMIQEKTL